MNDTTRDAKSKPAKDGPLLRKWKFYMTLIADRELSGDAKAVAAALLERHNEADGFSRPSLARIAEDAGTNVTAVQRALRALRKRGWFVVEQVWRGEKERAPNRYRPIWERATAGEPPAVEAAMPDQLPGEDQAESSAVMEYVFEAGVVKLTPRERDILEEALGPKLRGFLLAVERQAGAWTAETWRDNVNTLASEWLEPEPF